MLVWISMEQLMTPQSVERYLKGELTWAQIAGVSMEQAYAIAELGHNLFTQGKLVDAEKIFLGLVEVNPKDGYFQGVLGSILARQGRLDDALEALTRASQLGPVDSHVFVNRAEILLRLGRLEEGLADLRRVLEIDPNPTSPTHMRAKAMAANTAQAIQLARAQKDA
jgi:predicted Zn-dependent protease